MACNITTNSIPCHSEAPFSADLNAMDGSGSFRQTTCKNQQGAMLHFASLPSTDPLNQENSYAGIILCGIEIEK